MELGHSTSLFALCLALPPGHCIDVPGSRIRQAVIDDEGDPWRHPQPKEIDEYIAKVSQNWDVAITPCFSSDHYTIYKNMEKR